MKKNIVAILAILLATSTVFAAFPDRPTIAGAYGDLDGNGVINNSDYILVGEIYAGRLPYDPRADFQGKGRVSQADWVGIRYYTSGYWNTIPNIQKAPLMKLFTPNVSSIATPFGATTVQTFVWGNRPGVTEVKFGFSQNGVNKYVSEAFPPTGRCSFTVPTGLQGVYTLTVYGTTPGGIVSDSLSGVQIIPSVAPVASVSIDPSSPITAARNAANQLLTVFRLDIINGESLYLIDFVGGVHQIGGSFLWKTEAIRRFEIRTLDGVLISGSARWNLPGPEASLLPPEDKPMQPGLNRGLVPTSPVTLNKPLLVLVYGTTPNVETYTTKLDTVWAMRPEDGGNLLNMDSPFSEGLSHTVTLK